MPSRMLAALAGLILAAAPALSETKIVAVTSQQVAGGPAFAFITGLPEALTRDGVTTAGDGALTENTFYLFPEAQGVTLKSALRPGNGPMIPAGTRVDSFYLCIDTAEERAGAGARNGPLYSGVVQFDNPDLLGVVLRPPQLKKTADLLGRPDVKYTNSRFVGVDPFWLGQDGHGFDAGQFRFYGDANGIDCRRLIFRAKG